MYALALSMMTDDLVKDQMENGFKTKHEAWIEELNKSTIWHGQPTVEALGKSRVESALVWFTLS